MGGPVGKLLKRCNINKTSSLVYNEFVLLLSVSLMLFIN